MATQPHLVLDGAATAARMLDAGQIVFAAHSAVIEVVEQAVAERRAARLADPRIRVITAADGFVAGEASAVVNWAGGGRPVPTPTPPRLAETGLYGRPTLVQNAETLAHLALIVRHGADWFRAVGTAEEPGSMLVTVIGAVADPGVREIEIGTPVEDVLRQAGGPTSQLSAVLVGGYFGSWVRWPAVAPLPFSAAGLAAVRATPGAGLLVGAARRFMRSGGDGAAGQVPGGRVGRPVRPVHIRPRRHRGRPGGRGRGAHRQHRAAASLARPGRRPGRLPPPRRRGPDDPQRS